MVQRKTKFGIETNATLKKTWTSQQNQKYRKNNLIYEIEDGNVVSIRSNLNKNKNWEIIEQAPKIQKEPKEERKERNRALKKEEFQKHLETRGKHKEPPKKQDKEKNKEKNDEKIMEGVVVVPNTYDTPKEVDKVKNGFVVVDQMDKRKIYTHQRHKREDSIDYWDTSGFQNVIKNDTNIDFKAGGFLYRV